MPSFMMAYYGGRQPGSPEEGKAHQQKWKDWVESLGDKILNPGTPLGETKVLTLDNIEDDEDPQALKGFAVIKADNLDEALELAKQDPFLEMGGLLKVSQMIEMK